MGATADLSAADLRWLSPLSLWSGILAGPIAWAFQLTVSYAMVKWICGSQRQEVLHLVALAALLMVVAGAAVSWVAFQRTAADVPTDGGHPRQRAHFMALLGLTSSALFGLAIVASTIPEWMLDACQ